VGEELELVSVTIFFKKSWYKNLMKSVIHQYENERSNRKELIFELNSLQEAGWRTELHGKSWLKN
jgi:hypothetical protein